MPFPTDDQRDRPWLMRTYAGHSSAKESNALYRRNLSKGQTGQAKGAAIPNPVGEPGYNGEPGAPALGGTR